MLTDHRGYPDLTPLRRVDLEREGEPAPNGVGAIRVLHAVGPPLREEVIVYRPPSRFSYKVLSGLPVRDHVGTAELTSEGEGTRVVYVVRMNPTMPRGREGRGGRRSPGGQAAPQRSRLGVRAARRRVGLSASMGGGLDQAELRRRAVHGVAEEIAVFGAGAPDSRLIRRDGLVASVVPATPQRSIFNSVFHTDTGVVGCRGRRTRRRLRGRRRLRLDRLGDRQRPGRRRAPGGPRACTRHLAAGDGARAGRPGQ